MISYEEELETPVERGLRQFIASVGRPDLSSMPGVDVQYTVEHLSIGRMLVATHADGRLLVSAFAPDDTREENLLERLATKISPRVLRGGNGPSGALKQLEEYLAGARKVFDLPLDLSLASDFQHSVLAKLPEAVGYGTTISYGQLAQAIDRPSAHRAVGVALSANPLCVVLPCHRVISSSGKLNGYAGGVAAKSALLTLERNESEG